MRVNFVAPSTPYPSGGVAVIYEIAAVLAKRGHDVHLFHVNFFEGTVAAIEDIGWFRFPEGVAHHFIPADVGRHQPAPRGDVIFGFSLDTDMPRQSGLPVVLIQGYKMLGDDVEHHAYRAPCAKVCVASWLVDIGRELGVPDNQLVHVPIGIHHDRYRVTRPIGPRPSRLAFCYSTHAQKGPQLAIDVVMRVKQAVPELEVVAFGAHPSAPGMPDWITYVRQPCQDQLVDEIYNCSRVFLCTSRVEGFGLANVEAMACGAALVTTDNGGSRDYALHDETALVAPFGDIDALSKHAISLIVDDDRRVSIAKAGVEHVRTFEWDRCGDVLEAFLERYVADPGAYGCTYLQD
jgi:glycosyltransferase involved in cell wall biosynthesis